MPTGWFVIEPPTSGVMTPGLRRAKASLAGQQPYMGPMTPKLPKVLASLNGRVDPAGGIVSKLQKPKASFAGTQTQYGTMGAKLKKPTANFAVENQGQMSASIKRTLSALNGKQTFTGALGSALRRAKATIAGSQNQSGAMISQSKRLAAAFVGNAPGIKVNAVGTYVFGAGNATLKPTITIAAGSNIRLYAIITVTHTNWLNSYNAGKPGASSNVNGAFTQVDSAFLGNSSGYKQGSIWILRLNAPTTGAHTVSITCSASQSLSGLQAQLIAFNGVGSEGTITKTTNPSDSTPTSLVASSLTDGDMHLVMQTDNGSGNAFTGAWPSSPGLFVDQYQSGQAGDAKRCRAAYVKGDGASKTFSFTGSGQHATMHLPLIKA